MYGKLFASLYQGTLRGQSDAILVFTNMIAFADAEGFVDKHPSAIADETGLSIERVRAAIDILMAPDPESRSPENNGKRLVFMDEHRTWGWVVVNYHKYRSIKSEEDRREQNRLAQERFRNKRKQAVSSSKQQSAQSAQGEGEGEGEGEAEEEEKKNTKKKSQKGILTEIEKRFEEWYSLYPRKIAKSSALQAYKKAVQLLGGESSEAMDNLLVESKPRLLELAKKEKQFIPHPASWLNSGRWADELETPVKPISRVFKPGPDYDARTQTPHQYLASKGIIVQ